MRPSLGGAVDADPRLSLCKGPRTSTRGRPAFSLHSQLCCPPSFPGPWPSHWRGRPLTLVAGGDSPSAVMDFSSIFSSLVSSTAGFSTTSCFFSGLAVLAKERDAEWNRVLPCGPLGPGVQPAGACVHPPSGPTHVAASPDSVWNWVPASRLLSPWLNHLKVPQDQQVCGLGQFIWIMTGTALGPTVSSQHGRRVTEQSEG